MTYHTFTRKCVHFAYKIHCTNMAFKHISLLWNKKGVIMGHMGPMVLLPGQKKPGHVGDMVFLLG